MRRLLPLFAALTVLTATGCNRGATARAPDRTVRLDLSDYRISPQRVRVKPGRVTFLVRNSGHGVHNLKISRRGRVRLDVPAIRPGESQTVTARLKHGTYRMYCSLAHHEVLGEYGTVSVR
jgi:plastocyanin